VEGVSMVIFPEGARTKTGKMARFKRGAYQIAIDMKLPIVPMTINGAYDVLKIGSASMKIGKKMELIIHKPIVTESLTDADIPKLIKETREIIHSDLWEKYK
jgi:1-acyl-sn-glycerol-3-phosphate acyltransferase